MSAAAPTTAPAVPWGDGRPHPNVAMSALWRHIFGDEPGLMVAFSGKRRPGEQKLRDEKTRYFAWPDQSLRASQWLQAESDHGRCAYVCAHLVTKRRRVKENAAGLLASYVDADGATVPSTLPRPTAVVESSPGRDQLYWRLTRAVEPEVGEQLNKRLAYAMGADKSGWDLTQLLRAPGTRNYKYRERVEVAVRSIEDRAYDPDELDRILPPLPEPVAPPSEPRPAGRVTGTAATVLERMRSGKRGTELGALYDTGPGALNPSSADLSFQNGAAFYSDRDAAIMDQLHRSSALIRPKWDEVHYADGRTYGQHTIDIAVRDCHTSIGDLVAKTAPARPEVPAPAADGSVAPDEVAELRAALAASEADVARLHGVIDNLADVVHVQQVRLQAVIGELEEKTAFLSHVSEVLAKPNEELSAGEKVVSIALAYEIHFRADYGPYTLPDGTEGSYRTKSGKIRMTRAAIARRTGYSQNRASDLGRQVAERENAPFGWDTTREWKAIGDGPKDWVTTIEIEPRTARTIDTLRALVTLPALPNKPKHGGSQAAIDARAEARWGRCQQHTEDDVVLKGYCGYCGKVVAERRVTADQFDTLEHHLGVPEDSQTAVDVYVPKGHQDGVPDVPPSDELAPRRNGHTQPPAPAHGVIDSAWGSPAPTSTKSPPWRCPACRVLERTVNPDGSWRCKGGGHEGGMASEVAG